MQFFTNIEQIITQIEDFHELNCVIIINSIFNLMYSDYIPRAAESLLFLVILGIPPFPWSGLILWYSHPQCYALPLRCSLVSKMPVNRSS